MEIYFIIFSKELKNSNAYFYIIDSLFKIYKDIFIKLYIYNYIILINQFIIIIFNIKIWTNIYLLFLN